MARARYINREQAGQQLAGLLQTYARQPDAVVLALPRGGVPVAAEVAEALDLPLDLMLVRKLGTPGHEELAMGAIASGDTTVFNHDLLAQLPISEDAVNAVIDREKTELHRRDRAYRGDRPPPAIEGRTVILVDDGVATGATMRAAIAALRERRPGRVVVAVPVAPPETVQAMQTEADEVVCPLTPTQFYGVGYWYDDFDQTSDDEVRAHLAQAWQTRADPPPRPGL